MSEHAFHDLIGRPEGWATLDVQAHHVSPWLVATTQRVATPTRPDGVEWSVVHRKGAVVIAPLTPEGHFVLVRQERVPVRQSLWEFPAGQIDGRAGDEAAILATAQRELQEEAGYELGAEGRWVPLGYFFTSAAFTDEHSHLVAAVGVVPHAHGAQPEETEAITAVRTFTRAELLGAIARNEIRDANTLAMVARLFACGLLTPADSLNG
ncbi:MAG: NUDIX hydrolase [Verrucomicrobia bacterium]|nr:NUDIX hydrolase [Verrucomicrobiota bacterium]